MIYQREPYIKALDHTIYTPIMTITTESNRHSIEFKNNLCP
jgi:hypothetical protein